MFKRIKAFLKELFTAQEPDSTLFWEDSLGSEPAPKEVIIGTRPAKRQLKSILLSAGHSNADPGAVGTWQGSRITEADIVLDLRNRIAAIIAVRGYDVRMDGKEDQNLPLAKAIELAQQVNVAVELHCNAFHLPTATGVEVLTGGNHQGLSDRLTRVISSVLDIPNRGVKAENSGQHSRLGFISRGDGIIVELLFITNQRDLTRYYDNVELLSNKMAEALIDYIT